MEITDKIFLEGKLDFEEPGILSRRDKGYYDNYASHLTMSDVKSLCQILQYPSEEIFKKENFKVISHYGNIKLDKKEYSIGSWRVKDILLEINAGNLKKNDILHDTSKLLTKHKPDELRIKVDVYNYLLNEGYVSIQNKNTNKKRKIMWCGNYINVD